jgi:hypothetical protein
LNCSSINAKVEEMELVSPVEATVRPADMVEIRPGVPFPVLAAAYSRWRAEGSFPEIFHKCPDMSLIDFLEWTYSPTVEAIGCYVGEALVGVGWINGAYEQNDGSKIADVGAAFFKGVPLTVWKKALNLLIRHGFSVYNLSAMYGLCSRSNRLANLLTGWTGMSPSDISTLPWGEPVADSASVYRLDKETWRLINERRDR